MFDLVLFRTCAVDAPLDEATRRRFAAFGEACLQFCEPRIRPCHIFCHEYRM